MKLPDKKYSIIYADPPWSYNDKMAGHSFSLDHEYKTMSKKWIQELPVSSIAEKDCVLFLWVVSPMLDEGIETLKAWGFKYKTLAFCWSKTHASGKKCVNLGRWTMGNVELCILGTRGHPKRAVKNIRQLVEAQRGKHSAKPIDVRDRISLLMGGGSRIELFARQKVDGWDCWGDQAPTTEKDINMNVQNCIDKIYGIN